MLASGNESDIKPPPVPKSATPAHLQSGPHTVRRTARQRRPQAGGFCRPDRSVSAEAAACSLKRVEAGQRGERMGFAASATLHTPEGNAPCKQARGCGLRLSGHGLLVLLGVPFSSRRRPAPCMGQPQPGFDQEKEGVRSRLCGYRGREEQDTGRVAEAGRGRWGPGPCPSEPKGETAARTELESLRCCWRGLCAFSLERPATGPSLRAPLWPGLEGRRPDGSPPAAISRPARRSPGNESVAEELYLVKRLLVFQKRTKGRQPN